MSFNYSADQFDSAFQPTRLGNWEVSRSTGKRPSLPKGPTQVICDENGRFLSQDLRPKSSPWSGYKNTWQLPERISRYQANELNGTLPRQKKKDKCKEKDRNHSPNSPPPHQSQQPQEPPEQGQFEQPPPAQPLVYPIYKDANQLKTMIQPRVDFQEPPLQFDPTGANCGPQVVNAIPFPDPNEMVADPTVQPENETYIPGDFTNPDQQHPSRSTLLQQHIKETSANHNEPQLNQLYVEKHKCIDPVSLLSEEEKIRREKLPHVLGEDIEDNFDNMKLQRHIPDKPTERSPSPLIPAYCNFVMAKKMAQENLEHQPLPDCIMDRAFRKQQVQGDQHPGLALDVMPSASGVGVKTYKAGPTHCTKMKVYRPKTCGIVPKPVSESQMHRPQTSYPGSQKMSSMDLAICWDYRPANPMDEPRPPKHIDGSNGSAAPAVFTLVKTPRSPERIDTGRSAGIFTNTFGDEGFFDKDIARRKTNFSSGRSKSGLKCSCGTSPINLHSAKSSRSLSASRLEHLNANTKRYKSSPNLSQIVNVSETTMYKENHDPLHKRHSSRKKQHTCSKYGPKIKEESNIKRSTRLCHIQQPQPYPEIAPKEVYKQAFKAGIPKSNSSGTVTSFDSGCSTVSSSGTCSTKTLHVPKPRHPYAKKNYNIDTLVPPFACIKGGAGQGGYPEHWRLASVYQHAYKPIEQRKRPLLETVYK